MMDGFTAARFAVDAVGKERKKMETKRRAVVLLSGGQDSTTTFYWALDTYDEIAALSFAYGQRHAIELEYAAATADGAGVPHAVLPVEALSMLSAASLTNTRIGNADDGDQRNEYADARGLPPSFVPGRNALFFTLGAAWGLPRGYTSLVTGICEQDRAGYPDCRFEFAVAIEAALQLAMDAPEFGIDAPLITRSKAATWALADELGVLDKIIEGTRTCYEGDSTFNEWGFGCGRCGACQERQRGYELFRGRPAAV